jgi:hypothetical protein
MTISHRLWTYNPDNDDAKGDHWNGENFSWFSRSRAPVNAHKSLEQTSELLDDGARILEAIVRPYAAKVAGIPLHTKYEMETGRFNFSWVVPSTAQEARSDGGPQVGTPPRGGHVPLLARETEIFLPTQLTKGRKVIVCGLAPEDTWAYDEARQTLFVLPKANQPGMVHSIEVSIEPALHLFVPNDFWSDFGSYVLAVGVLLLALLVYWAGTR